MDTGKYVAVVAVVVVVLIAIVIAFAVATWYWGGNVTLLTGETLVAPSVSSVNGATVSLALGDVLLFKTPEGERGAIRFDHMTDDGGADYTSWFIPADSTASLAQTAPVKGHVFEKYWRTRTGRSTQEVQDLGGNYQLRCGTLSIAWSASTWVYLQPGYELAIHNQGAGAGPDFDEESLEWYVVTPQETCERVADIGE